jgi:hypothetical protein
VLFFGEKEGWNAGLKALVNAAMMVLPSELAKVRVLAVSEGLFLSAGQNKGGAEMNLRCFWERVQRRFTGLEEVLFVGRGEDPSVALEERRCESEVQVEAQMEGLCYADDELGFGCWEEERFEEKIERVVKDLEKESGWVAPQWRVLGRQTESSDMRIAGFVIELQKRKEKEDILVRKMREMFGHEEVSNAL